MEYEKANRKSTKRQIASQLKVIHTTTPLGQQKRDTSSSHTQRKYGALIGTLYFLPKLLHFSLIRDRAGFTATIFSLCLTSTLLRLIISGQPFYDSQTDKIETKNKQTKSLRSCSPFLKKIRRKKTGKNERGLKACYKLLTFLFCKTYFVTKVF